MATIADVEKLALELPERERAVLAERLLDSLSPTLHDGDEGVVEALRRDADFDANPASGISLRELDELMARRHG